MGGMRGRCHRHRRKSSRAAARTKEAVAAADAANDATHHPPRVQPDAQLQRRASRGHDLRRGRCRCSCVTIVVLRESS